jgi:nitrate reductase molybdenum cofactor assembly chaperone NarJ/NarW
MQALENLGTIIRYPAEDFAARLHECRLKLREADAEAAGMLMPLLDFHKANGEAALEELFTRTFDLNPDCALEVGWHAYGEQYERGTFLVKMREHMRRLGVAEDHELPDHLSHALTVLSRMEGDEATELARAVVLPAVKKMLAACEEENPYASALRAIDRVLEHHYAAPPEAGRQRGGSS